MCIIPIIHSCVSTDTIYSLHTYIHSTTYMYIHTYVHIHRYIHSFSLEHATFFSCNCIINLKWWYFFSIQNWCKAIFQEKGKRWWVSGKYARRVVSILNTDPGLLLNPTLNTFLQRSWHHHPGPTLCQPLELLKYIIIIS